MHKSRKIMSGLMSLACLILLLVQSCEKEMPPQQEFFEKIDLSNLPTHEQLLDDGWEFVKKVEDLKKIMDKSSPDEPIEQFAYPMDTLEANVEYLFMEDGRFYKRNYDTTHTERIFHERAIEHMAGIPADFDERKAEQIIEEIERSYETKDDPSRVLLGTYDNRILLDSESLLTQYPYRTIGKVVRCATCSGSRCSGVKVGPRHVLTAAHCLYNSDGWYQNRYFAPGQRGNENPNGPPIRVVARYARTFGLSMDYGLLILEDTPETVGLGWMGMGWYNNLENYEGRRVYLAGYPGNTQQCQTSPRIDGECGGYMYLDVGNIQEATSGYLMYDLDATRGNSGSGIWTWIGGSPMVFGVHKRGNEPGSGAVVTSSPANLNLGPRVRPRLFNDICNWMGNFPSAYANHPCTKLED